jgi:tellurite resistance protein TerC
MTYLPAFDFMGMHFNLSNTNSSHVNFATNTFFRPNIVLTLFGFFLVYAGIKSALAGEEDEEQDYNKGLGAKIIRKIIPVSRNYHGDKFFIRRGTKRFATRLLLVMVVIESTDLIFAVDSIPAIFAIAPDDPFILYTSNIFAILGLRSMYFLLANSIDLFSKLKYGLAFILTFIGVKMLIAPIYHFSSSISLLIVLGVLVLSIIWSVLAKEKK